MQIPTSNAQLGNTCANAIARTSHEKRCGKQWVQVDRMFDQVQCWRRVDRWYPHQAAPAQVVPCSVVSNVHRAPVATLPPVDRR